MSENGKILYLDPNTAQTFRAAETDSLPGEPLTEAEALAELMQILDDSSTDPVLKLAGYLISEDPTYLPEGTSARTLARRFGRDKLLEALIRFYLNALQQAQDGKHDE